MERVAGRLPDLSIGRDAISSTVSESVESGRAPGDTLGGTTEVAAEDSVEVQAQDLGPSFPMEERDAYARLWVPDADTTAQESAPARRARRIVLACLNAMGGVDRLEALQSMAALVWVRATSRYRPPVGRERPWVYTVPAYAHPVSVWRFEAGSAEPWERMPYTREEVFPSRSAMVPYYEVEAFYRFFEGRWRSSPPWSRTYRERSEGERWKSPATTRFERYEEIQGVLWPTRWRRSEDSANPYPPYSSTILLSVAFNGEEPSQVPPRRSRESAGHTSENGIDPASPCTTERHRLRTGRSGPCYRDTSQSLSDNWVSAPPLMRPRHAEGIPSIP